ncbi:aminoglycoside 6-adenylyltransferase [Gracilibacillus dipsosauri]|uniref:Aminoglycoside adenylyltransferase n=1 Tax=Gracilibacillus dipsosauri TaxID=178340 RepID=A0A317KUE8_9BACI|nr:aminoglycoside 6-adenylyltransferase [Gracilibacillus dipsosauri]PWU66913.1 aminoglycoside adenylyltransferase [Gracilibacillus dipsosauri]
MRSEQEIMSLVMDFAEMDERVRVVGMNGSRTNDRVKKDLFQDYDIVYIVKDMSSFIRNKDWIDYFGKRLILQTPEAMTLYPATLGNWFSYLMLFEDGNRIDLMLIPLEELDAYLGDDSLTKILLDKDDRIREKPIPNDRDYHVKKPSAAEFDDCCNEFWWVTTYVAKGLCRKEFLFAADHFEKIVRKELFRMLEWKVGVETKFQLSVGKSHKYLDKYVSKDVWNRILTTYKLDSITACWDALYIAIQLFRETSIELAKNFGYHYPDYDEKMSGYLIELQKFDS